MSRIPLYYTFGNHMHWVDMQWLWGYHVLPGSIRDMLHFCRETGAKGNVNFDGIGYEKLAAEDPEALAELREAVQVGMIEPVGCSYGQPYGLFHGGESNIRQRVYGARTVRRLLGVWPRTFWEEEFDFFPQLPQMLRGTGFEYASLFFQWTWHTPEVPKEDVPVIWWEGQDGSRLLCATRNKLNLHQWPEDMDATFAELALAPPASDLSSPTPLILQWLELMPSPDWMCRSELLLPKMRELLGDERFEIRFATLGEYLQQTTSHKPQSTIPTRKYSMDDVWHGMSLGKNGDSIVRKSHEVERAIRDAETLSSTLGLFGRPYAQWDVYPTWELEEAWRETLAAQHHDNHECEGLCGRVGWSQFEKALKMTEDVLELQDAILTSRVPSADPESEMLVWNPLGWKRSGHIGCISVPLGVPITEVEAWGWAVMRLNKSRNRSFLTSGALTPSIEEGLVTQIVAPSHSAGCLAAPLGTVTGIVRGKSVIFQLGKVDREFTMYEPIYRSEFEVPEVANMSITYGHEDTLPALDMTMQSVWTGKGPDPGIHAGWRMPIRPSFKVSQIFADQPYGVSEVKSGSKGYRKYPTGDWMTSPQWFEEVVGAFTSISFVDLVAEDGTGLLVIHDGSQQFWLTDGGVDVQLSMLDPWDENRAESGFNAGFRLIPHGTLTNSERWRLGQEFLNPLRMVATTEGGDLPAAFSALSCDSPNVIPTAFYRETENLSGKHVENYAGRGMGYPFIVRLVEFDGLATEATLTVAGTVAAAYKTNLLGQIEQVLHPPASSSISGPDSEPPRTSSREMEEGVFRIQVSMRPYEIARRRWYYSTSRY